MSTSPVLGRETLRNIRTQGFLNGIALLLSATHADATLAKQLSWGDGAPTHTAATGSVYIRLDAADSDLVFYRNTDGAATWETIVGSELTDLLAATNAWTAANTFSHASGVTTDTVTERSVGAGVTIDGVKLLDSHIVDSVGFYDAAAPTKIVRLDAGAVTAGNTRVLAMPDADVTITTAGAALLDDAAAVNQRATLGLVIGTDVQAYDADLAAIAALVSAADKIPYSTGVATWVLADFTAAGRALVDDASAAAQRTTLGVVIGTDVQAYDADLAAIAALVSAADKLPYSTGVATWALADFSAAGRALVDDASAAAQRTTLGLVIGTDVQAYDASLLSLAALATAADRLPYATGVDTYAEAVFTAAGRALVDDASAVAQRTTLGLVIGTDVQAYDADLLELAGDSKVPVVPSLAAAAEAGNAIAVTIGLIAPGNGTVGRTQRLHCRLYAATMIESLAASFTMAETGTGTEISTTANAALLIDTDAAGAAIVTVTDVSGVFVGTVYLEVAPVNLLGSPRILALVFA